MVTPNEARAEVKAKAESIAERRHKELLEAVRKHGRESSAGNVVHYNKLINVENRLMGTNKILDDLLNEEETFHAAWHTTQTRLEKHNTRLSSWHLMTNVLRLIVNAGILIVLVMYLMDMG